MTEEIANENKTEENNEHNSKKTNNSEDDNITDLEESIIQQVEYYFGDMNLPRDKFLKEQIQLDEGWIPLELMLKFRRLSNLSSDPDVIANAIEKSTSGLLEVSEDRKKIRRNPELPLPEFNEERRKELASRTIYAKHFPKMATMNDLIIFFNNHEKVENIIMRKYQERKTKERLFKGSVFATFKTREQAEKFLSKPQKYENTELLTHWQEDYVKLKQEEYLAKKEKKDQKNKKKEEPKEELKLPTGTVLHFSQGHDKMTRENVKEALETLGAEVAFIDFKVGDTEGWVRMSKENTAGELLKKMTDAKVKIGESEVVFRLLEGEEEKSYLEKTVQEMAKRRKNSKQFKGKHSNKYGGKKRKQNDQNSDEPPKKVQAVDD